MATVALSERRPSGAADIAAGVADDAVGTSFAASDTVYEAIPCQREERHNHRGPVSQDRGLLPLARRRQCWTPPTPNSGSQDHALRAAQSLQPASPLRESSVADVTPDLPVGAGGVEWA